MGCNCGGARKNKAQRPRMSIISVAPVERRDDVVKTIAKGNICTKCGWMMAKIRYKDIKTNQHVEKYTCPNRKCPSYNQ